MGFLFFLFVLAAVVYLYNRLSRAEDRLNEEQNARAHDSELISELTRRVWALEKSQTTPPSAPVAAPAPKPHREPVVSPPPVVEPVSIVVPPLEPTPEPAPVFTTSELF